MNLIYGYYTHVVNIDKTFLITFCYFFMNIESIWIVISTIVFTLAAFSYPNTAPYYWGFRGFAIILAIIGWFLVFTHLIH